MNTNTGPPPNSSARQLVDIAVAPMRRPDDVSVVRRLLSEGVRAEDVVAVIGKSEGSGLGDDTSRAAVDRAVKAALADAMGIEPAAVANRVCFIISGGCPGVISPHVAMITRRFLPPSEEPVNPSGAAAAISGYETACPVSPPHTGTPPGDRLVVGLAHSERIEAHEVGRTAQVDKVADAVAAALRDAGVEHLDDIHAVLVKAPALSERSIAAATSRGLTTVTRDLGIGPEGAICYSNDGSALGVAVALGEVDRDDITDGSIRSDYSLYSEVAFASSGGEQIRAEVVVLANAAHGLGDLRAGHSPMRSILDIAAPSRALDVASGRTEMRELDSSPSRGTTTDTEVAYVMAKMIIPGSPDLLDLRTTLHDDPHGYHVAKGMGGYLVALTTGTTTAFVSGGERNSHQGPPEGNPFAVVVRIRPDGTADDTADDADGQTCCSTTSTEEARR